MKKLTKLAPERIDELGNRFIENKIGTLLNITFGTYIDNPEYYDELIAALDAGHGLHLSDAGNRVVVEINGHKNH